MSNETKPLTAEEWAESVVTIKLGKRKYAPLDDIIPMLDQYAAQQNAALREELERQRKKHAEIRRRLISRNVKYANELDKAHRQVDDRGSIIVSLKQELSCMEKELEAVKRERDKWKNEAGEEDENGNLLTYAYWKEESFNMQEFATKCMKQRDEALQHVSVLTEKIKEV